MNQPVRVAPEAYYLFDAAAVGVPELCDAFKVRYDICLPFHRTRLLVSEYFSDTFMNPRTLLIQLEARHLLVQEDVHLLVRAVLLQGECQCGR